MISSDKGIDLKGSVLFITAQYLQTNSIEINEIASLFTLHCTDEIKSKKGDMYRDFFYINCHEEIYFVIKCHQSPLRDGYMY